MTDAPSEQPFPPAGVLPRMMAMVYDAMLKDGFAEVQERYLKPWFR